MRLSTADQLREDSEDLVAYLKIRCTPAGDMLIAALSNAVADGELRPIQVQRLMYKVHELWVQANHAERENET